MVVPELVANPYAAAAPRLMRPPVSSGAVVGVVRLPFKYVYAPPAVSKAVTVPEVMIVVNALAAIADALAVIVLPE